MGNDNIKEISTTNKTVSTVEVTDTLRISRNGTHISEKNRYLNTLVLGKKNSGKSNNILTLFAKQDFEKKDCGLTFIVSRKDMAYTLYAMARNAGRKDKDIIILKPSANFNIANDMIWQSDYSYEKIARFIDYKDAIKNKKVVIIDMEYSQYRDFAIRATAMLLMQLQQDMQDIKKTLKRKHYIYIDDAHSYLPFIELLLTTGEAYNVGTMLFMQSREELNVDIKNKQNYLNLLDNNIRNVILTNGLNTSDADFYRKQLIFTKVFSTEETGWKDRLDIYAKLTHDIIGVKEGKNTWTVYSYYNINDMISRRAGLVIYETLDSNNLRTTGTCQILTPAEDYFEKIKKRAVKIRKTLNNEVLAQCAIHKVSLNEKQGISMLGDEREQNPALGSVVEQTSKESLDIKKKTKTVKPKPAATQIVQEGKPTQETTDEIVKTTDKDIQTENKPENKPKAKTKLGFQYTPLEDLSIIENAKDEKVYTGQKPLILKTKEKQIDNVEPHNEIVSDKSEDFLSEPEKEINSSDAEAEIESVIDNETIIKNDSTEEETDGLIKKETNDFESKAKIENEIDDDNEVVIKNDLAEEETNDSLNSEDIDEVVDIETNNSDMGDSDELLDALLNSDSFSENIDDLLDFDMEDIEQDVVDLDDILHSSSKKGLFSEISKKVDALDDSYLDGENSDQADANGTFDYIDEDDDDDEEFDLGIRNYTNVDETGLISKYRPKRKTIVFPKTTREINERYLNDQFKNI